MPLVMAVDPGRTMTAALTAGGQPAVTTIREVTPQTVLPLIDWVCAKGDETSLDVVLVMEDQYVKLIQIAQGPGKRARTTVNIKAVIKVVRAAEVAVVLAELRGIRVERVLPGTWQSVGLKGTKRETEGKRLSTKARAREAVAQRWDEVGRFVGTPDAGLKPTKVARLNQHERDAMLMATWWLVRGNATGSRAVGSS